MVNLAAQPEIPATIRNEKNRSGPDFALVIRRHYAVRDEAQPVKGGLAPWQLRRLETFISENITRQILVSELAAVSRLSSSYFSRAFARTVGLPPHHMVNLYRMARAAWLIGNTADPLADIAQACGLCDQAHLTRLFRRFYGTSPAAWRLTADPGELWPAKTPSRQEAAFDLSEGVLWIAR